MQSEPIHLVKTPHPNANENIQASKLTLLDPSVSPPDETRATAPATKADLHILEAVTKARLPHRGLPSTSCCGVRCSHTARLGPSRGGSTVGGGCSGGSVAAGVIVSGRRSRHRFKQSQMRRKVPMYSAL